MRISNFLSIYPCLSIIFLECYIIHGFKLHHHVKRISSITNGFGNLNMFSQTEKLRLNKEIMHKIRTLNSDSVRQSESDRSNIVKLLKKCILNGFIPDMITFSVALQESNRLKQYDLTLQIFELMTNSAHVEADRLSYGMALSACMYSQDSETALKLFEKADILFTLGTKQGFLPQDMIIYTLTLSALETCSRWSDILIIYNRLINCHGTNYGKPTVAHVNTAMKACKMLRDWKTFDSLTNRFNISGECEEAKVNERLQNAFTNMPTNHTHDIQAYVKSMSNDPFTPSSSFPTTTSTSALGNRSPLAIVSMNQCLIELETVKNDIDVGNCITGTFQGTTEENNLLIKKLQQIELNRQLVNNPRLRRRINRLIDKLIATTTTSITSTTITSTNELRNLPLLKPSFKTFQMLIRAKGCRDYVENPDKVFTYLQYAIKAGVADRGLYREVVESCVCTKNKVLIDKAKLLLITEFGTLSIIGSDLEPMATFLVSKEDEIIFQQLYNYTDAETITTADTLHMGEYLVRNGEGIFSDAARRTLVTLESHTDFHLDVTALPEAGINIPERSVEKLLLLHCEKQALSALVKVHKIQCLSDMSDVSGDNTVSSISNTGTTTGTKTTRKKIN